MKIILIVIVILSFFNHTYSNELNCNKLDKLSKDYAKCIADKSKKQGKMIKDKIDKELEKTGIKEKYKKFDSKKTLKDLFKKE
tara:strand:- start:155 stop:403 length:249 start_codon:yes stop_codon:yes gene_type:complete